MKEVIQVRLREAGNTLYYDPNDMKPKVGDYVIWVRHTYSYFEFSRYFDYFF